MIRYLMDYAAANVAAGWTSLRSRSWINVAHTVLTALLWVCLVGGGVRVLRYIAWVPETPLQALVIGAVYMSMMVMMFIVAASWAADALLVGAVEAGEAAGRGWAWTRRVVLRRPVPQHAGRPVQEFPIGATSAWTTSSGAGSTASGWSTTQTWSRERE